MNFFHEVQVGEVEDDRLEIDGLREVEEEGAVGRLGVIGWGVEGDGMATLKNTGILSGGLSLTDLQWLSAENYNVESETFTFTKTIIIARAGENMIITNVMCSWTCTNLKTSKLVNQKGFQNIVQRKRPSKVVFWS